MKLDQMTFSKGRVPKWTATLTDIKGDDAYELNIRGAKPLVERVFKKSEFEFEIDPDVSAETAPKEALQVPAKYLDMAKDPFADPGENAFKKPPGRINERQSVIVSVRRTRGRGTRYVLLFPQLFVPAGVSLFFVLPWVQLGSAVVFPLFGDADLFLHRNSPTGLVQASSTLGGLSIDSVDFNFFNPFGVGGGITPFFRVFGVRATVATFWATGVSV
jgi:hypothetical protein